MGGEKAATRARNGAPLPGRRPSIHVPHRSASSALCPCGHAASFRRRASSFVRGVWCLEFGGAVSGGGALRAHAVRAACRAACSRVVLPCGCGCCCGGVCVATLTTTSACRRGCAARRLHGARAGCHGGVRLASCRSCGRGVVSLLGRCACAPPVPVLEMSLVPLYCVLVFPCVLWCR